MIVDSVLGFNEVDLFDIRYNELNGVVDEFIILEATHTHSGKPKSLYFSDADLPANVRVFQWDNGETFAPLVPEYAWVREHTMREVLRLLLLEKHPDAVVMVSDMDEIPSAESVHRFLSNEHTGIWRCEQTLSYLYLNTTAGSWHGTRILHMRDMPQTMKEVRYDATLGNVLTRGGWHFSSVGGAERVKEKIVSFAHTELANMPIESIQDSLARVVDPFNKQPLTVVPLDTLPRYVIENHDRFAQLIYTADY